MHLRTKNPAVRWFLFCCAVVGCLLAAAPAQAAWPDIKVVQLPSFPPEVSEKDMPRLEAKAKSGDAEAKTLLALLLAEKKQDEQALTLIREAAAQNYPPAVLILNSHNYNYNDPTLAEEVSQQRLSAAAGYADSARWLGEMYLKGNKTESNGVLAYAWLYLAAHGFSRPVGEQEEAPDESEKQDLQHLANVLTLSEQREVEEILKAWPKKQPPEIPVRPPFKGTRLDSEALLLPGELAKIKTEAEAGNSAAMITLAIEHLQGVNAQQDSKKGVALLEKAASLGNAEGDLLLAKLYAAGFGVTKNPEKALEIYSALVEKGNAKAMAELGELRLKAAKENTKENEVIAAKKLIRQAAEKGSVEGMLLLASELEKEENYAQAAQWYERASGKGNEYGMTGRISLAETQRNFSDLYLWIMIYIDCLPPEERLAPRNALLMFSPGDTGAEGMRLKQKADAWVKNHPALKQALAERARRQAEYYKGRDITGRSTLHKAILENDLTTVERLLNEKADPNIQDKEGNPPLHEIANAKGFEAASALLRGGARLDAVNSFGETALDRAIECGNLKAVEFLLSPGTGVNSAPFAPIAISAALYAATKKNNPEMVAVLLKAGANPNAAAPNGETPLRVAGWSENSAMLKILLSAKADPNHANGVGNTALHGAAGKSWLEGVQILLEAKANPNLVNKQGETPLYTATDREDIETINMLLKAGALPDVAEKGSKAPLCLAVTGKNTEAVKSLLKANAKVDVFCGSNNVTPLHEAASRHSMEPLKLLLKAGANPNIADSEGNTPLKVAARRGKPEAAALLLEHGANPNMVDKYGNTILSTALDARENATALTGLLLKAGANPNTHGYNGATPLHQAGAERNHEAVKLLMNAKADPNALDENGKSVVDVTADPAILELLEKTGGKSVRPDSFPIYDELGRPVNKAAEQEAARRKNRAPGKKGKEVMIIFGGIKESEAFAETLEQERAGNKSPYLTRAVLMDLSIAELGARIKAGAGVNEADPVFGTPLQQAVEQQRSLEMVNFLLAEGADPTFKRADWDRSPLEMAQNPEVIKVLQEAAEKIQNKKSAD